MESGIRALYVFSCLVLFVHRKKAAGARSSRVRLQAQACLPGPTPESVGIQGGCLFPPGAEKDSLQSEMEFCLCMESQGALPS